MSPSAHHPSHRRLIKPFSTGGRVRVDAIIVPSARRAAALDEAGRLAGQLGCVLLVLCSKHADARWSVRRIRGHHPGVDVIAVDFPARGVAKLPVLETTTVLARTRLQRTTDTSAKRNLGLVLARLAGWQRVVFLDDDITVPDPADLERAAALLDTRDGVGLHIGGYPDNSVVCHANRETGAAQDTFIGGGALVVPTDRMDSFFPEIYNEDWFFLLGDRKLRPVGQVGVALQRVYDPFADPGRARGEEFGDVLAEGLFALFDDGGTIADANTDYWEKYLEVRRKLIEDVAARIGKMTGVITDRDKAMKRSLTAASGRLQIITPEDCVVYVGAWERDRKLWQGYMNGVHPIRKAPTRRAPIEIAVTRLKLEAFTPEGQVGAQPKRVQVRRRQKSAAPA